MRSKTNISPMRAAARFAAATGLPGAILALALCLGWPATAASAQVVGQAYGRPDIQVLIAPAPGGDLVDLTYPTVVSTSQAERDVNGILRAGGWHATDVEIDNGALPVQGKAGVPMTSVSFQIEGAAPAPGEETIRIEPWIIGLSTYNTLALTYILPPDFKFGGLSSYRDSHVQIALDQAGTTLTYHVRILGGGRFTSLGLPLTQAQADAGRSGSAAPRKLKLLGILIVGLVAAGVGYAVYALLSRLH